MRFEISAVVASITLGVVAPQAVDAQQPIAREIGSIEVPGLEAVTGMIADWPETPRMAANTMIEKYGAPDGVTSEMIVWHDSGPWTHTIVYREPVQHDFPMPHEDVLEQFIHYDVPPDLFDELAEFDGSVIVERTKGVISARCDKEAANFLAINLAHDIVTGEKSVAEARAEYGEVIQAFMAGDSPEYTAGLTFDVPEGGTADPDEKTIEGRGGSTN